MKKGKELILKSIGIEPEDMTVIKDTAHKLDTSPKKIIENIVSIGVEKLRKSK